MTTEQQTKLRGLWEIMGSTTGAPSLPTEAPVDEPESSSPPPSEKPKSLWAVMSGRGTVAPAPSEMIPSEVIPPPLPPPVPGPEPVPEPEPEPEPEPGPEPDLESQEPRAESGEPEPEFGTEPEAEPVSELEAETAPIASIDPPTQPVPMQPVRRPVASPSGPVPFLRDDEDAPTERWRRVVGEASARGISRMAAAGGLAGMLSLPAAFLSVLPGAWVFLPAMLLGCTGLILSLLGLGEISRSRGRKTGRFWAVLGLVAGCVGMFLGPLFVDPQSDRDRDAARNQTTRDHLRLIAQALDQYHARQGRYPAGGTFEPPQAGVGPGRAMHGWNTALLPYLGHDDLFRELDFDQPWNAEANRPFMKQSVREFQAGGHNALYSAGGYGLSHFSGVGGEVTGPNGESEPLGVFDRNSEVTRLDVTDGLADTLIVGEVATNYSPWGQPGNWRTVGEGLNREYSGFGNPAHTGAHFLTADGSVRFLSNTVSPEVLRNLSTRSGAE